MLDLKGLKITLDFLCLTFRSDLEELVPGPHNHRTTSFCSSSSGILDANNPCATLASQSELSEDEDAMPMDEEDRTESISRQLLHIPEGQRKPVKAALAEIEWMLRDEIVAFMLDSFPMLESTLVAVRLNVFFGNYRPTRPTRLFPCSFSGGPTRSFITTPSFLSPQNCSVAFRFESTREFPPFFSGIQKNVHSR